METKQFLYKTFDNLVLFVIFPIFLTEKSKYKQVKVFGIILTGILIIPNMFIIGCPLFLIILIYLMVVFSDLLKHENK